MSTGTEQPPTAGTPAQPPRQMSVPRIVFGTLAVLLALALLAAGGAGVYALTQRGDDDYFTTKVRRLATPTFALASSSIDISDVPGWLANGFATVKVRAISPRPVFIGIGSTSDVNAYLQRVPHTQITDFETDPFRVKSHIVPGTARPAPPANQRFWEAQASGPGTQTITWDVKSGTWSAVAMNADGTRNVLIAYRVGARINSLVWVTIGVLVVGLAFLALGGWLIYSGLRPRGARPQSASQ
jgi:hypothetical protein